MSKGFLHKASLPEEIIFAGVSGEPAAFSVRDLCAQCIIQVLLSQRAYILMRAVLHILCPPSFPGFRQRLLNCGTHKSRSEVHKRPLSRSAKNKGNSCSYPWHPSVNQRGKTILSAVLCICTVSSHAGKCQAREGSG